MLLATPSRRRFGRRGVVVDVGLAGVVLLLVLAAEVVAVRHFVVVVGMRMPVGTVLEVVAATVLVMM